VHGIVDCRVQSQVLVLELLNIVFEQPEYYNVK
jgi:hypothetical protein